jgi:hypothetical protein
VLPSLNFPQLDFVKPSSGFHPVTWERVINHVDVIEYGENGFKFGKVHNKKENVWVALHPL